MYISKKAERSNLYGTSRWFCTHRCTCYYFVPITRITISANMIGYFEWVYYRPNANIVYQGVCRSLLDKLSPLKFGVCDISPHNYGRHWHAPDCYLWVGKVPVNQRGYYKCNTPCWQMPGLTHWGRDEIDAILQTTFSNAFYWMKMYWFRLKYHWSLFPRIHLTARRRPDDKPLSEPMVASLLTHICVTRPQWVNHR